MVGIQSLTIALTAGMVLLTGAIVAAISATSSQKILRRCERTTDETLDLCQKDSDASAFTISSWYMRSMHHHLAARIDRYLEIPENALRELANIASVQHPDMATSPFFVEQVAGPGLRARLKVLSEMGTDQGGYYPFPFSPSNPLNGRDPFAPNVTDQPAWGGDIVLFRAPEVPDDVPNDPPLYVSAHMQGSNGSIRWNSGPHGFRAGLASELGLPNSTGPCHHDYGVIPDKWEEGEPYGLCTIDSAMFDITQLGQHVKLARTNAMTGEGPVFPADVVVYSPFLAGLLFSQMYASLTFTNPAMRTEYPAQGKRVGTWVFGMSGEGLNKVMQEDDLPRGAVLYAVQHNSYTGVTGEVVGTTVGRLYDRVETMTRRGIIRAVRPIHVTNHTIERGVSELTVVGEHGSHVWNSEDRFEGAARRTAHESTPWTTSNGTVYWTTTTCVKKSNAVLFVTLLVPRSTVMANIDRSAEETQARVSESKEDQKEKLQEGILTTLGVMAAVVVCIIVLSVALVRLIVSPLLGLQADMEAIAVMDLDAVCPQWKPSWLSEVALMQNTFHAMHDNLVEYRKYLPQGVLQAPPLTPDGGMRSATAVPPGDEGNNTHVAIVFTDIKESTRLWEASSEMMTNAMRVHNRLIRSSILFLGGYEVKTIGDSFMVAFATMLDAVQFGLDVQQGLHDAEWPPEFLDLNPLATASAWPGLRVRIGVHYGPVTMEYNNLTERMDYLGPTVNRAARLEGAAPPGGVAVLREMYEAQGLAERLENVVARDMGMTELKGVTGELAVVSLSHEGLEWATGVEREGSSNPLTLEMLHRKDCVGVSQSSGSPSSSASLSSLAQSSLRARLKAHSLLDAMVSPTRCTVACIHLHYVDFSEVGWNKARERFMKVAVWMRRTEGTIVSVAGLTVFASWGLVRRTGMHTQEAFRFASLLQMNVPVVPDAGLTCCLSTGVVSGCHAGDWEFRFLTYGGRCLGICWALCALDQRLQARVLYGAEVEHQDPTVAPALRPVGRVEVEGGEYVVAHEVCARRNDPSALREDGDDWGWSSEYSKHFMQGDMQTIRRKAEALGDAVLLNVCKIHATGS